MAAFGVACVLLRRRRRLGARGAFFVAAAPLALGSVMLTRFDLWPAALTAAAFGSPRRRTVCASVSDRSDWRRRRSSTPAAPAARPRPCVAAAGPARGADLRGSIPGRPRRGRAALRGPVAGRRVGLFWRQAGRPLQIESLGAGSLLVVPPPVRARARRWSRATARRTSADRRRDVPSAAFDAGSGCALVAIWIGFARGPADAGGCCAAQSAAVSRSSRSGRCFRRSS